MGFENVVHCNYQDDMRAQSTEISISMSSKYNLNHVIGLVQFIHEIKCIILPMFQGDSKSGTGTRTFLYYSSQSQSSQKSTL